jgi:hypothetical protein
VIEVRGFTTPPAGATSYTATGPAGGPLNVASSNFTVTPNGAYAGAITITPSGGGLSTPTVLTFNGSAAQTFTITPTAAGPVTLTFSNNGSLTDAPVLTYATPPAPPVFGTVSVVGLATVAVAFTPPGSNGGSPITLYTATCNPGAITATGTSSPIQVTGLPASAAYTCTLTASNAYGISAPSNSPLPPPTSPSPSTLALVSIGGILLLALRRWAGPSGRARV